MNERIKELAREAGFYANPDVEKFEKFAELIVKECIDAVGDGPMQRPEIQRIKAKFGVEYYEPIEKAFGS
jgi:hypothetical protein